MGVYTEGRVRTLAALGAAAVLAMSAGACASTMGMTGNSPDAAGMATAGAINQAEVEEAQVALQMSTNPQVRQYAQRMIAEHGPMLRRVAENTMAMGMLTGVSQSDLNGMSGMNGGTSSGGLSADDNSASASGGMTMMSPTAMAAMTRMLMENPYSRSLVEDHMRAMQMLQSTARGMAFDHAYLQRQVAAHQSALAAIDNLLPTVQTTGQAETRGLLMQMRPAVEQHLRMAQEMMAGMNH